jgi:2-succinyl-5-enolpyruvyl-6-hydroxy-3-cyclohexene-1-carboxylate synthase
MQVAAPLPALLAAAAQDGEGAQSDWLEAWRAADRKAAKTIAEVLGDELSEPLVAARLGEWLPPSATLFAASSMPIRDLESFLLARQDAPRVLSNRGANGIDGTVSAAFGVAAVSDGPVVLMTGDVALAHDIGGLLSATRLGLAVAIVLLNNDGGGIFHFLPVAVEGDAFEQHVVTPHQLNFAHAAALYSCRFERARTPAALRDAVERALSSATTIVEVPTDREQNLRLHRRVEASVREALSPSAPAAVRRA